MDFIREQKDLDIPMVIYYNVNKEARHFLCETFAHFLGFCPAKSVVDLRIFLSFF